MFQKKVLEKVKIHIFMFNNSLFFFFKILLSYELMWKNIVEVEIPRITM